jgi:hypothetical protein
VYIPPFMAGRVKEALLRTATQPAAIHRTRIEAEPTCFIHDDTTIGKAPSTFLFRAFPHTFLAALCVSAQRTPQKPHTGLYGLPLTKRAKAFPLAMALPTWPHPLTSVTEHLQIAERLAS